MNIVVAGERGRLGSELVRQGCIPLECDNIANDELVAIAFDKTKPDVVINCAAFTVVDISEDKKIYEEYVIPSNVIGPVILAWTCGDRRIPLIHLSSDYVFGDNAGPYKEVWFDVEKNKFPSSKYAISKLSAEIVMREMPGVTVVRTTGLYGYRGDDFAGHIIRELVNGRTIDVTKELRGNQTYIPHLAEALIGLARLDEKPSLIHLASREVISRYEFALMIASVFGYDKTLIKPVKNRQISGWVADRPTKGGLRIELAYKLGLPIYGIVEGLESLKKYE